MSTSMTLHGRRCWIVGASSGIGAALATELRERGAHVAISARREDRLEGVSQGKMVTVACDVTDPAGVAAAARSVDAQLGGIDLVVWSAGTWGQFDPLHWDRKSFAEHVEVNLLGLNNVLAAVLPPMVERRAGQIVGIASVAGYRGLPGAEAYGATKAAQLVLLEALRASLAKKNVLVTTVAPGFVRTEMTESNSFPMPFIIDADQAARAIADGLERGRHEIVFPLPMAVLMKIAKLLPQRAWDAIAARFAREKR
jgi:short-subunit dehydrogenase